MRVTLIIVGDEEKSGVYPSKDILGAASHVIEIILALSQPLSLIFEVPESTKDLVDSLPFHAASARI